MDQVPPPPEPTQLIVFADDWGRHPSSSQHLIRELLPHYPTLWVNTVGTRKPRLSDIGRVMGRIRPKHNSLERAAERVLGENRNRFRVIQPMMYPGFRKPWQRRFNTTRISKAIEQFILPNHRVAVITTLPITADLIGRVNADRWVYYCVDDYSQWPGADQSVMQSMEHELVAGVDALAPVSDVLAERLREVPNKSQPKIITHGVDLNLWAGKKREEWNKELDPLEPLDDMLWWYEPPEWTDGWEERSVAVFWGLIDDRMDVAWLASMKQASQPEHVVLVGPSNAPPDGLERLVQMPGNVEHNQLPAIAERASVLIMPYIDAPVTRAMQPLKLLEYLATMKPVVVRDLPSTRDWADCCDLASDAETFVRLVEQRSQTGIPLEQTEARKRRLANESWTTKAAQLAAIINAK